MKGGDLICRTCGAPKRFHTKYLWDSHTRMAKEYFEKQKKAVKEIEYMKMYRRKIDRIWENYLKGKED